MTSTRQPVLVDAFCDGDSEFILISPKAGGTDLNLTSADCVIHLDQWWNRVIKDQTPDRADRIGQIRLGTVYRLVARTRLKNRS